MIDDPIVEEMRAFRTAHAKKYDNDLDCIVKALKEGEKKHGKKLVNREAKGLAKVQKS